MTKLLLCLFGIVFCSMLYGQYEFEPGYIMKDEKKLNVLIKNEGWYRTPNKFEYKLNENSEIQSGKPSDIQEFYIENSKYKFISRNFQHVETIPAQKNFLRVLVDGKASLYTFNSGLDEFIFFEVDDKNLELLDYKTKVEEGSLKEFTRFRLQLFQRLKCENMPKEIFEKLAFSEKDLIHLFNQYNECKNSVGQNYTKFKNKGDLNLYVLGGTGILALGENSMPERGEVNSETKTILKVGIEIEYLFPINKNKLGMISGVNYSQHSSEGTIYYPRLFENLRRTYVAEYNMINIPLGVRYYSFLHLDHKIFVNLGMSYHIMVGDNFINTTHAAGEYWVQRSSVFDDSYGFFFGVGYKFKSRLGFELNFTSNKSMQVAGYKENVNSLTGLLSYKIF